MACHCTYPKQVKQIKLSTIFRLELAFAFMYVCVHALLSWAIHELRGAMLPSSFKSSQRTPFQRAVAPPVKSSPSYPGRLAISPPVKSSPSYPGRLAIDPTGGAVGVGSEPSSASSSPSSGAAFPSSFAAVSGFRKPSGGADSGC